MLLWLAAASAAPEMIPIEVFEAARAAGPVEGDIELPLRGGGTFRMAEHRGSPVLLTFWASWCAPCRLELPDLAAWKVAHPDVQVVAVNIDRTEVPAERFLKAVAFDLPVAFDPEARHLGAYAVESMPTMFVFDHQGSLAWRHTGYSRANGFTELDAALGAL